MAINSVSLLNNNSALELLKANAVQFSNKNNSLNKVTTEKESNKLNAIKDSVNISKEALEKFMSEKTSEATNKYDDDLLGKNDNAIESLFGKNDDEKISEATNSSIADDTNKYDDDLLGKNDNAIESLFGKNDNEKISEATNSSTDDIDDKNKRMYNEDIDNKSGQKLDATNAQTVKCNNATTSSSVAYKLAALKVKKAYC